MLQPLRCQGLIFSEACLLEEYYFLFGISALYRPTFILEIGGNTGLGSMALWLGAHSANNRPAYITTIEHNADYVPFIRKNWAARSIPTSNLTILTGDSKMVVPKLRDSGYKADLCFIDGDHSYEGACADWNNTQGMVGVWLLHDSTQMSGVRRLIRQIRATNRYNVFGFDEYPFGTQWNHQSNCYSPKKSIPGITIVTQKDMHYKVTAEERTYLDVVRANENTQPEILVK